MQVFRLRVLALPLLLCGGGCASIVEGTTQTVTVRTEPAGALCELRRGGTTLAVANPTPTSVTLSKSKDNVSVECSKQGYDSAAGSLSSDFQGMTFGNILFGGFVGLAIDASTGAMHEYPPEVTVMLKPNRFYSEAERDAWYRRLDAQIETEAASAIEDVRRRCKADQAADCNSLVQTIERERDAKLQANERSRLAEQVPPTYPGTPTPYGYAPPSPPSPYGYQAQPAPGAYPYAAPPPPQPAPTAYTYAAPPRQPPAPQPPQGQQIPLPQAQAQPTPPAATPPTREQPAADAGSGAPLPALPLPEAAPPPTVLPANSTSPFLSAGVRS